jgi:two-component system sensor kinase FixL
LIIDQLESHIRQRKQYADALKVRESELRSVLETVVDGILTFDEQGAIDSFNPAAGRIFGYEPEEALGMNIRELLNKSSQDSDQEGLSDIMAMENGIAMEKGREVLGKRKCGTTFPLHLAISARDQGDSARFTAVVRDLTDFKRMQRKVLQAETLAAIGEMAASVAHEIKNPLAGIGGAIQVLEESMERSDPRRELMQEILAQVDRLDSTVRQLLMLSKPQTPQKQRCDLRSLLERVIGAARRQNSFQNIDFVFEGESSLTANVDPSLFEQVIWNLLENSDDAMPEGGQVILTLQRTPDADILKVRDTGPGVPLPLQKKLFRPFFTTKTRGTGLGLSICKKILDAHEGSIWINGEQRNGTEVVLSLPRIS